MNFRQKLDSGRFVVTGEVTPHKGINTTTIASCLEHLRPFVDAVNVTDNQRACVKASSLAVSKIILDLGVEPIFQLTCRDRNRIALQSDLMGAHMLGIRDVLALSGDHPCIGDHPGAKPVYDLDSSLLLEAIGQLNRGLDLEGHRLDEPAGFFAGASLNPAAKDREVELLKAMRKLGLGAKFFQTQVVYDVDAFIGFMKQMPKEANVIAGIIPLKSAKMARFMQERMPGVSIPSDLVAEIETSNNPMQTGIKQAASIISQIKTKTAGIHIMALGAEQHVGTILRESGVFSQANEL
jgi:5,10-methylenetetrahydrofolate reductase